MITSTQHAALRVDIAERNARLLPLKRSLRRPWPSTPMGPVQRQVAQLASEITERLILLAWSRGRRHLSSPPRWMRDAGLSDDLEAYQARVAVRIAATFPDVADPCKESA